QAMTQKSDWPNCFRIVHLAGGLRAFSLPGKPTVLVEPGKKSIMISEYKKLFSKLDGMGLYPIGCDFFTLPEQIDLAAPEDWRPMHFHSKRMTYYCNAANVIWSRIASTSIRKQNWELADLARRISFETRCCTWRLRDLSEAYYRVNVSVTNDKSVETGERFQHIYGFFIFYALHALLIEMCILRDYLLLEFTPGYVFNSLIKEKKFRDMAHFYKRMKKFAEDGNDTAATLADDTHPDFGWLTSVGNYRRLIVHYAPIPHAKSEVWMIHKIKECKEIGQVPYVHMPLPNDPVELIKHRRSGTTIKDKNDWLERFKPEVGSLTIDALEYSHEVLGRLMFTSYRLAQDHSPVPPEQTLITQNDVQDLKITEV
ncbi:MAG: hypothetical protein KJ621_20590, partial [Proteobacteria bacterium]|nr:hypothetical protein [Pseudomonadota bacterium]